MSFDLLEADLRSADRARSCSVIEAEVEASISTSPRNLAISFTRDSLWSSDREAMAAWSRRRDRPERRAEVFEPDFFKFSDEEIVGFLGVRGFL
jgi:hypothetical protein